MKRYLPIILASAVLAGCGQQSKVPQDSFYRLTAPAAVAPAGSGLDGVLVVPRFLSDGLFSERPVVYASAALPEKLQQYHYHFWMESPARMLQELTVDYLRKAGVAPTIVTPEMRATADYELIGKVKRLEQLRGDDRRVLVSLEFGLYRVRDNSLVLLRSYDQSAALNGEDVAEAAEAMSRAVTDVLASLVRDVAAL